MIRGTRRPVRPTAKETLELRASIHNRFDVEVLDAATGELKQRAVAYNIICDALWDRLVAWPPQNYFNYVLFGKGTGTPSSADTELFDRLGAVSAGTPAFTMDRRRSIASHQATATLQAEEYVGETLTEVGIGYDSTHCVTHALLQDMNGNPITITKTSTDVIKIYATVYLHWPVSGWYGGSINLAKQFSSTSSYNYANNFVRILLGYAAFQSKNFIMQAPARCTGMLTSGLVNATPTVSRAAKTFTLAIRIPAGSGNLPIRAVRLDYYMEDWVYSAQSYLFWITPGSWFSPPAITGEAVGTGDGSTTVFSTAFPVKTAGTVYVNGAAASGAAMRTGPANAARMDQWMNGLAGKGSDAVTTTGTPLYDNETNVSSDYIFISGIAAGSTTRVYENPFYSVGIGTFSITRANSGSSTQSTLKIQCSDDCTTWTDAGTATGGSAWNTTPIVVSIPSALQHKRYWRFVNTSDTSWSYTITATADVAETSGNIVFSTPPAAGAVITADYVPDCIAKDSNHVFDLQLVLTLGEYSEV